VRVWGEQSHDRQRVDALTGRACLTVGEQSLALFDGDERLGHGRDSHETDDAWIRFAAKMRMRRSGCVFSCGSTKTQAVESVHARKRRSGIVQVRKDTDAAPRFCRNPPMRISVKARMLANFAANELKITWF
jgi:hypothetical protein